MHDAQNITLPSVVQLLPQVINEGAEKGRKEGRKGGRTFYAPDLSLTRQSHISSDNNSMGRDGMERWKADCESFYP